jgi:hypothetical protein
MDGYGARLGQRHPLLTAAVVAAASALPVACNEMPSATLDGGGPPTSAIGVTCRKPTGLYMDSWLPRSGNTCKTGPDGIVNFDKVPAVWAGTMPEHCSGEITPSADSCEYTFDVECIGPTLTYIHRGRATWIRDLSRGAATIYQLNASAITGSCSGTFDATWTKR